MIEALSCHDPSLHVALPASMQEHDRQAVAEWLERARLIGVEAVQDLCDRPWPVSTEATILGVFRAGEARASWLVVGQQDGWAVASCERNQVLGTSASLIGALSLILSTGGPPPLREPQRSAA